VDQKFIEFEKSQFKNKLLLKNGMMDIFYSLISDSVKFLSFNKNKYLIPNIYSEYFGKYSSYKKKENKKYYLSYVFFNGFYHLLKFCFFIFNETINNNLF
jgi:hypothetical protein